ncbi:uncharacterized protein JCM10292_005298 [Rhodotorula paludigena]|uniref:uncharacterized protein n=1 Tax=Rhodotorula paludigena TaxID=86838 RepID=UPI0031705797
MLPESEASGSLASPANAAPPLPAQLLNEDQRILQGNLQVEESLFNDPFSLLDSLVPLLNLSDDRLPSYDEHGHTLERCLDLAGQHSSPREIVMAVEQQLAGLRSPDEQDDDDDDDSDRPWDPRDAAARFVHLARLYGKALSRLSTKQPHRFLEPAVETLTISLMRLVEEGAFVPPPPASTSASPAPEGDVLPCRVLRSILSFLRVLPPIFHSLGPPHENLLQSLLCTAVALLHPYLPTGLAQNFFYSRFPAYRRTDFQPEVTEAEQVWRDTYAKSSRFALPSLLETVCSSAHPVLLRVGGLVALAHLVAADSAFTANRLDQDSATTLYRTLDIIRAGLESPAARLSDDVVLFWLWHGVEGALASAPTKTLDSELIFYLIDLLTPLAALSPSPQTRFLSFRLISRLLTHGCTPPAAPTLEGETLQLALLAQLVRECPVPSLRVASVGLVKEVVLSKLSLPRAEAKQASQPSHPSLFLAPSSFLSTPLGTSLLSLDPPQLERTDAEAFIHGEAQQALGARERLSLWFVLLKREGGVERMGLGGAHLGALRAQLVDPLKAQLAHWLDAPARVTASSDNAGGEGPRELDPGTVLELQLVSELVGRVDEAVKEVEMRTRPSEPYDPYIPGSNPNAPAGGPGPSTGAKAGGGSNKTQAIQQQIDDTVGIMRDNITKVAERGERLDALQDKTDNLAQSAQGFRRGANRVRKQMWWKDMKMRVLIAVGIAILVIVIVVPIVVKT